jgi:hypothetical protein
VTVGHVCSGSVLRVCLRLWPGLVRRELDVTGISAAADVGAVEFTTRTITTQVALSVQEAQRAVRGLVLLTGQQRLPTHPQLAAFLLGQPSPHPVGLPHGQRVAAALLQDGATLTYRLGAVSAAGPR